MGRAKLGTGRSRKRVGEECEVLEVGGLSGRVEEGLR